ncbi:MULTISPECIES: DsbE family thiol:disulfide interchange protein [unclassified Janthinobacterium]|uniref:DsbE family thiol:disulfide interchange protein n=1 Tax=unclassified Janthinobacterium TaxID=2610881 RepID=UPI0015873BCC|nr:MULTISPECIES: DsbE family thiol:disulfide interchange protein [unclassified Janthinobacterium]
MRWPKKQFWRGFAYLLPAMLLFLAFIIAIMIKEKPKLRHDVKGLAVSDFMGLALQDETRIFDSKSMRGKVWILNAWASWCTSCTAEHATLIELKKRIPNEVIGLNYKDERSRAIFWLDRLGNPYHESIFDSSGEIGVGFGVRALPETFIIDGKGVIRYRHSGILNKLIIEEKILPIINRLENSKN